MLEMQQASIVEAAIVEAAVVVAEDESRFSKLNCGRRR